MSFRPRARLDPRQVTDLRGRRGGGALVAGGGTIGVIVVLAYLLLGGDPAALQGITTDPAGGVTGPEASTLREECKTGVDANERQDCRIVGYVNSIQEFWSDTFAESGERYEPANTVLFTEAVSTGCGTATSQVGPFYCPNDRQVYLDLGFFQDLQTRLGATGGSFAEGYVVAHEYGHHIQNLLGVLQGGGGDTGAESRAVRTELMADCFAGVWANGAETTGFLQPLRQSDIAQALDAASSVGDDRIQERLQGQVTPETWTHGSSEQRTAWFTTGYQKGNVEDCDTFAVDEL
jgi:uncharacterized protein